MVHLTSEEVTNCYNDNSQSLLAKWDIPINHLDYDYIETCDNGRELERIVRILRSGQEGVYPDLLDKAEARLAILKPSSKVLIKNEPALTKASLDSATWKELTNDLAEWSEEVTKIDSDLNDNRYRKRNDNLPEVRKAIEGKAAEGKSAKKPQRIKSHDYAAWDKYDPDLELLKEDLAEQERKKEEAKKRAQMLKKKKSVTFVPTENLTETEIVLLADRERNYGNECFKAGDYDEAKKYYTHSIQLRPTAAAYNNRCLANYKLKKYASALDDSEQVLKLEPQNTKALFRKAQIYNATQNYRQAYETLQVLISIDPSDSISQNLMNQVVKCIPVDTPKKHRLKIIDETFESNRDETTPKIVEIFDESPKIVEITDQDVPPPLIDAKPDQLKTTPSQKNSSDKSTGKKMEEPKTKEIPSILKRHDKVIEIAQKYKQPTKTVMVSIPSTSKSRGPGVRLVEVPISPDEVVPPAKTSQSKRSILKEEKPKISINKPKANESKAKPITPREENKAEVVPEVEKTPLRKVAPNARRDDVPAAITQSLLTRVVERNMSEIVDEGSCGEPSPNHIDTRLITTPYEFTREWQAAKLDATLGKRAALLRRIPIDLLPHVIAMKLDGQMLSDIFKCLELFFMHPGDISLVKFIMTRLIDISRFHIVALFLEKSDKIVVKNLLDFLTQHNCQLQPNVLQTYKDLLA